MRTARNTAAKDRPVVRAVSNCRDKTHNALLLCDLLEELADALPHLPITSWRTSHVQCQSLLPPYFRALNDLVIPEMVKHNAKTLDRIELLVRLKADCLDQAYATQELEFLISQVLSGKRPANEPETLGFALRGHFEPLRRNLLWQADVLWPLAVRTWPDSHAHLLSQAFEYVISG